jgi:hypothetical protein
MRSTGNGFLRRVSIPSHSISEQRHTGEGDQVGLELIEIHVKSTIESQGRRNRRHNLRDKLVEMLVRRARNVEVATANFVDSLVVYQESTVRVLNGAVGCEDRVVRLDDGSADSGRRVDGKLELRLFAVVLRKTLEEEGTKTGTGTTTKGVEDKETLQAGAVV